MLLPESLGGPPFARSRSHDLTLRGARFWCQCPCEDTHAGRDCEKTVAKARSLIEEAARHGAALIAFPETYVPAFPLWSAVAAPIHNHEWFKRLASALRCPGPELERIAGAARRHGLIVSLGFNEGTAASSCPRSGRVAIDLYPISGM